MHTHANTSKLANFSSPSVGYIVNGATSTVAEDVENHCGLRGYWGGECEGNDGEEDGDKGEISHELGLFLVIKFNLLWK